MSPPRVSVIVTADGSVALMRRVKDGEEYYVLPGGSMEEGESPEQTARREIAEELAIGLGTLDHVATVTVGSRPEMVFKTSTDDLKLELSGPEALRQSSDNIYEPLWVKVEDVPWLPLVPPEVRSVVLNNI